MTSLREQTIERYRDVLSSARNVHEIKRRLAQEDLFFLLVYILGRRDVNRDWLFDRCREVEQSPNGYLDLWAREHYKSTIITYGLTIRDILRDPEITVGIFSYSRPIAKAFLRQIKLEFEGNEKLRALFPDIIWENPRKDAPKWSEDDGIVVKRKSNPKESTIEAWGLVDAQPTSKHFRLMIYDDVLTIDCVTNPEMIAKVTASWAISRNLTADGGATRYIGTRWHYADTYGEILKRGSAIERRYAITKEGTVDGTPVLFSRETVAQKRRDMGPHIFATQMLLDPSAEQRHGFLDEWLRYYNADRGDYGGMNKYLLCDPANSKKDTADYTAMAVIGLASDNNYYLIDGIRDRLSLTERADALFALHRRWKPNGVGYEQYGAQADIQHYKSRMADENYRFEITELKGRLSKADRIGRMAPIFEQGRFWLPEVLDKIDYEGKRYDLVTQFVNDEYKAFPVAFHDDFFDMLSRIVDPDLKAMWPKPAINEGRYARNQHRRRQYSHMAA